MEHKIYLKISALFFALGPFILSSCSANAPSDGICTRTCGARPIGGGRLASMAMNKPLTIKCSDNTILKPYKFTWLIYEDRTNTATNTSGSETTAASKAEAATPKRIPKGGIAFTPNIVGQTAGTNEEGDFQTSTSSSEWCTDSCGYATIEVTPSCAVKGDLNVGIIAPGDTGEVLEGPIESVTVTIAKPD